MVGVQEANPFRESASALLGGGQPLSSGVERNDISQFARRINFPAKSTIFNESEPSVAIYQLSSGRAPSKRQSQPREYSHRICAFMRYEPINRCCQRIGRIGRVSRNKAMARVASRVEAHDLPVSSGET